jgi:hypothetical protein
LKFSIKNFIFRIVDGSDVKTTPEQSIATNKSDESPSVVQKTGAKLVTLPKSSSACAVHVSTVFGYDDDEEDGIHQIKKKIKPFEITREVRF